MGSDGCRRLDHIVEDHHGYLASSKTVGRCLKYAIEDDEGNLAGTFWLGSGFKPTPKAILGFFGMSQGEFDKIFNEVADNKRMCLLSREKNFGTRALKAIRSRARSDWRSIYGDDLRAIVTTIGGGRTGSLFLADNWKVIGETAGLPSGRESVSMKWDSPVEINRRYVKPTGENKKLILVTTSLERRPCQKRKIQEAPAQDVLF